MLREWSDRSPPDPGDRGWRRVWRRRVDYLETGCIGLLVLLPPVMMLCQFIGWLIALIRS